MLLNLSFYKKHKFKFSSSLVVAGDLKFYFQVLGHENMSSSLCC